MQTIGKKREKLFIQIRKRKKRQFFKESRANFINKRDSKPSPTSDLLPFEVPTDQNLKIEITQKCEQSLKNLLQIKEIVKASGSSSNAKLHKTLYKPLRDFINENNPHLGYSLLCLFRLGFFKTLIDTLATEFNVFFVKLIYSFGLMVESNLVQHFQGKVTCLLSLNNLKMFVTSLNSNGWVLLKNSLSL
jgi:hypothetical protein